MGRNAEASLAEEAQQAEEKQPSAAKAPCAEEAGSSVERRWAQEPAWAAEAHWAEKGPWEWARGLQTRQASQRREESCWERALPGLLATALRQNQHELHEGEALPTHPSAAGSRRKLLCAEWGVRRSCSLIPIYGNGHARRI